MARAERLHRRQWSAPAATNLLTRASTKDERPSEGGLQQYSQAIKTTSDQQFCGRYWDRASDPCRVKSVFVYKNYSI